MSMHHNATTDIETRTSEWLANYLASSLEMADDEMDRDLSFERMGLDSSAAVALVGDLGDWLGFDLDPTMAYDYPSINLLSKEVARFARSCNRAAGVGQ